MKLQLELTDAQVAVLARAVAKELGGSVANAGKATYTIGEAAQRLQVCAKTVQRRVEAGTIPRVPGLKSVRIPGAWLDRILTHDGP